MEIHKLLARQLINLGLNEDSLPNSLAQWQDFIQAISVVYSDLEEEAFTMQRSMEQSSHEIIELNKNLESAQHIAGLGYWTLDVESGSVIWSSELKALLGLASTDPTPSYAEVLQMLHPNDVNLLVNSIENTINTGAKYSIEIRMLKKDRSYVWLHAVGAPIDPTDNGPPYNNLGGTAMDITLRKEHENAIQELNQKLIFAAQKIGMSDVANSVVANLSTELSNLQHAINTLLDKQKTSQIHNLLESLQQLLIHTDDLGDYLMHNAQGKLVTQQILTTIEPSNKEYSSLMLELSAINTYITSIRQILVDPDTAQATE